MRKFHKKMDNQSGLRPKLKFGVGDDAEDELLQFQELFQRSNMKPAAQVIREPKTKRQQSTEEEEKKKKTTSIDLSETTVMRPLIVVSETFSRSNSGMKRSFSGTRRSFGSDTVANTDTKSFSRGEISWWRRRFGGRTIGKTKGEKNVFPWLLENQFAQCEESVALCQANVSRWQIENVS